MTSESRAVRALTDIVAVETVAPGMVRVVSWSDAYVVDARDAGCNCPDSQYNLEAGDYCKHHYAAIFADTDFPSTFIQTTSLETRTQEQPMITDGGTTDSWTVYDPENDNRREFESRSAAEDAKADLEALGVSVELHPPNGSAETDGGNSVVDAEPVETEPTPDDVESLPERTVADDPLTWVPGHFVDDIDGTQAINRRGYEVLSHFYEISVSASLQVGPDENDHEYARVKATAETPEGRTCEAFGSAHVDRGDDSELLLEMADTRARKRALAIATGVGAVAVEELKAATNGGGV